MVVSKLLRTFAPSKQEIMKMISGTYRIADCENYNDVERAKSFLMRNNCSIVHSYWDRQDCGEAYINFICNETDFPTLYNIFGNSATFNANINDYVVSGDILPYKKFSVETLRKIQKEMENDLTQGFEYRIPLCIWFAMDEEYYSTKSIVDKCLSYLKEPYEVIGYSTHIVDGTEYVNVLLVTNYKNLTNETIGNKGIGDYCLGDEGYLKRRNIYGECDNSHILLSKSVMRYYSYLQKIVEKLHNKEDLVYSDTNYYSKKEMTFTADEYFDTDGTFKAKIVQDGVTYKLKDPRFWL